MRSRIAPVASLAAVALVWLWAAIAPVDRFDWFLENLLIFLSVPTLLWLYRKRPFSAASCALVAAFLCLHLVGSHWSYSNVPVGYTWFGSGGRNGYDRVVHFAYGLLLAYPLVEAISARWPTLRPRTAWILVLQFVLATSALYEIVEMVTAYTVAPSLADAFLGSQGDPFDAVWDMTMAFAGSLVAALLAALIWLVTGKSAARRAKPVAR